MKDFWIVFFSVGLGSIKMLGNLAPPFFVAVLLALVITDIVAKKGVTNLNVIIIQPFPPQLRGPTSLM